MFFMSKKIAEQDVNKVYGYSRASEARFVRSCASMLQLLSVQAQKCSTMLRRAGTARRFGGGHNIYQGVPLFFGRLSSLIVVLRLALD